ncbi:bifunctional 4-hydroxy-2-oxoglutarate aldolase/2-dehydro-3-deoxy-phosphogluconate aldolase [bacterium]|nr:bifunctional 4-hydroxy-2-oxoglutarate aldolase/2-dehydro-3-deoxy-phosphogluconate aldolase [bacterium]MCP5462838.1 bifunctional 4-hydroxy-2-oxoglutarate aldolase/2-dehydro-3-deoxy-phosphogluconate aldolase [bacterium]
MDDKEFALLPLMGILRGIDESCIEPLVTTVIDSGIRTIEIAMNTPNAASLIRRAKHFADGKLDIGAGTVLSREILDKALEAGATFIVLPTLVTEVVSYCVSNRIPVFPGAFTPQEIFNAWNAGATMVKVFPAKFFGPEYMREIKGPFDSIKLLACGGVAPDTLPAFFSSGADAVAFGGSVFSKELIAAKKFNAIGELLELYVSRYMMMRKHS